ncbi:apc1 protein [Ophiostoma piceae UAMH 11346]|uniref:Apc1 protein n=1 Tax=Ophiostoma piceae (strain UAMH 11346) TaxID=1262450 RepID=S3CPV1_OPHP1|nr:apc1 protein [Ophiostoma piceae UAMH 11346]
MASVTSLGVHEPAGLRYAIAEGILPPNAGADQYEWKLFDDENGEDELFTTATCVVWSRGGEVGRCLRFDVEQEPISSALLAYFPTSEDDVAATSSTTAKTTATPSSSFSKSSRPSAPTCKSGPPPLAKSLIVFLRTQAHVYSFSGGEYIVHMPFEVDSAIAAPRGVIIQRKSKADNTVPMTLRFPRVPPNSFVSSQILPPQLSFGGGASFSTAGLGKPKPLPMRLSSTLDTMWDTPLESSELGWPRLVCLTDPMSEIGLVVTQPEKASKDRYPRSSISARTPFLDPAEEILHVESIKQGPKNSNPRDELVLAVTVNRDTSMYSVWRMTYLNAEDQLTRRRKSKTDKTNAAAAKEANGGTTNNGGNRRRSSMAPNLASGATTPHISSFRERESMGPPQPMKRTRKSERLEREKEKNKDSGALEKALSMETGRISDGSRRQSRRASSHLARADLSASHERPMFPDPPGGAIGAGASTSSAAGGRRVDSHGSQRGRNSSGYGGGAAGSNLPFSHTLNSLLESPVDGLLEELRSGGDFEGFHNMGLDDPEFDGLTKEVLFTKIHSMSMDTTNLRYSLLNRPAAKLCKVFIIVGTPYSVDEQDRNYLLVCIQDVIDKRLQLLTLHVQVRGDADSTTTATPGMSPSPATSITWGQHRKAQNVADSCVIHDGDQSMIFILSEGDNGHRQLSIQAPWSELTTISIPPLSLHNRDLFSTTEDGIFQTAKGGEFGVSIKGLRYPRGKGVIDVVDEQDRLHQVQIQLEPRSARVRQVLNVLRSVLPASHAEKVVLGWWQLMQWLNDMQLEAPTKEKEWTALVTELCILFLAALGPAGNEVGRDQHAALAVSASSARLENQTPAWAMTKAWNWALADENASSVTSFTTAIYHGSEAGADTGDGPLAEPIRLAKLFMATEAGDQAIGQAGYLPTALSVSESARQKTIWGVTMALHLLAEEEKLDIMSCGLNNSIGLRTVVHQLCVWLNWQSFVAAYALELPTSACPAIAARPTYTASSSLSVPQPENIPNIVDWIRHRLTGQKTEPFLSLRDVFAVISQQNPKDAQRSDDIWKGVTPRTLMLRRFFDEVTPFSSSAHVLETMHKCGFTPGILDTLPEGMATPFQDAITRCQQRPPSHWSKELYELVGRGDMNTVLKAEQLDGGSAGNASNTVMQALYRKPPPHKDEEEAASSGALVVAEEPESEERQVVIHALFRDDKRLFEAQNLLSSTKPRVVRLYQQPEWSEPEYLERQKELVTTIATGTLATSAGRGMLNYGFRFPLLTQKFNVQGFNLTCIVRPSNVAVGVDKAMFTEEKVNWAFFHQGVAYGLAISARAKGIDTSWIVFNKPGTDLSHRHAGFLLALGLNGHLKSVAKWVAFKYLTPKHMMTSIGLLLGLAVSHLGTMDSLITRLLSVHVTRMLPRGAAELNLSHQIQTTGIMGIGLLYYNSQHRRMSEIMMSEIEYMEDEDDEDPLRNEGYRLAAAFALGFINLGKGSDRKGLLDMHITEQLLSLASSTKKVELVNVLDRAAPAATIALALIYMKTEDHIVARKIDIPQSSMQFDYVRPDVLLLRTLAKNLIMWNEIRATPDWIRRNLPAEFRDRYQLDDMPPLRTQELPFFSILAGLCFALALRFAGSGNTRVRDLLVHYLDQFINIVVVEGIQTASSFDAQLARGGARMCLDVLALSCATVMAGTGDLEVLRRLRLLHGRDDAQTTYGSHMAAHLAIGTLFLGSGTTTFGNSNLAVAALLVAFYPIFPTSVQDNGSHLQAFRHFWVLATEPRCLVTKDAATGQPISIPILVYLKPSALSITSGHSASSGPPSQSPEDTVQRRQTPCLLPPLDDIIAIRTDASAQGFWDLEVGFERDPSLRAAFQVNQNLYLRRRPAHESVFSTTLQALSRSADATASLTSDNTKYSSAGDPLEWLFGLDTFKGLSRTERAFVLGEDGDSGSGGSLSSLSSVVDARLALAGGLHSGWGRDRLLDLRLLFDWADQRSMRLEADRTCESRAGKSVQGDDKEIKDSLLPPWPSTDTDKGRVDWWMSDSAIDKLKSKVWLIGQEE